MFNETVAILRKLIAQLLDTKLEQILHVPAAHTSDDRYDDDDD